MNKRVPTQVLMTVGLLIFLSGASRDASNRGLGSEQVVYTE